MSEFDKLTGVKKLRIRGRKTVRYFATMKAAGPNLLRAAKEMRARKKSAGSIAIAPDSDLILSFFKAIKERRAGFFENSAGKYRAVYPLHYVGSQTTRNWLPDFLHGHQQFEYSRHLAAITSLSCPCCSFSDEKTP